MIKHVKSAASAAIVLMASSTPLWAVDSVDLKVSGTIMPTACTPTLSRNGSVDFGQIKSLSSTNYTLLPEITTAITINCDAPAKVAIKPTNGRPGTLVGTEGVTGYGETPSEIKLFGVGAFAGGLGTASEKLIGGYSMRIQQASLLVDGAPASVITSRDKGTTWMADSLGLMLYHSADLYTSWASVGNQLPVAFRTMSATLGVEAYVNKSSELDMTQPISLDGLSTLEMVYL